MLFFGVFLHETARPVAKSRTNLPQIQEKLPNGWTDWHQIWHTCADSSGNGYNYAKQSVPQDTRGNLGGGGLGDHKSKVWEAVKRLDRSAPNLVHICGFAPRHLGGLGGHKFKNQGKIQTAGPIGTNFVDSSGNGYTPNKLPRETQGGHLGGFRGSNNQRSGKAVKRLDRLAPTLVHICGFIWEWV